MSIDITKSLFRKLATDGQVFSAGTFRTLKATYFRIALDRIETFYNDAVMNGLTLDRHEGDRVNSPSMSVMIWPEIRSHHWSPAIRLMSASERIFSSLVTLLMAKMLCVRSRLWRQMPNSPSGSASVNCTALG